MILGCRRPERIRRLFLAFVLFVLASAARVQETLDARDWSTDLDAFRDLVNQARREQGLCPLDNDLGLQRVAERHCERMMAEGKLGHEFPGYPDLATRAAREGLFFLAVGENAALSDSPVAEVVHEQLMKSPPHRKTILDPRFTHVGLAVAPFGRRFFFAQVFAKPFAPYPVARCEEEIRTDIEGGMPGGSTDRTEHFDALVDTLRSAAKSKLETGGTEGADLKYADVLYHFWASAAWPAIRAEVARRFSDGQVKGFAVGVHFGRGPDYPGGAYSVALLIDRAEWWRGTQYLSDAVLERINRLRNAANCPAWTSDADLSRSASETLLRPLASTSGLGPLARTFSFSYETTNLWFFPPLVMREIGTCGRRRKAGIALTVKRKQGHPVESYLVTILTE